ncbi:MAG TPA: glycosyltransferase family 4 protein, partial [Steroidobacter sp.]|nr:glycosyltransferase family 4 protein [Steroidobacter sp.]
MTADAVGGVWTYALDLCSALSEQDVEVMLATMGPRPTEAQRRAARVLDNVQLVESDYRLEWMTDPWGDVATAGEWLIDLAASNDVDLIHLNGYSHAALPWRRPVVCVAHSCVSTWWQAVYGTRPPEQWNEYCRHVTNGLNSADAVIAPTAAFLQDLRSTYAFTRPARV